MSSESESVGLGNPVSYTAAFSAEHNNRANFGPGHRIPELSERNGERYNQVIALEDPSEIEALYVSTVAYIQDPKTQEEYLMELPKGSKWQKELLIGELFPMVDAVAEFEAARVVYEDAHVQWIEAHGGDREVHYRVAMPQPEIGSLVSVVVEVLEENGHPELIKELQSDILSFAKIGEEHPDKALHIHAHELAQMADISRKPDGSIDMTTFMTQIDKKFGGRIYYNAGSTDIDSKEELSTTLDRYKLARRHDLGIALTAILSLQSKEEFLEFEKEQVEDLFRLLPEMIGTMEKSGKTETVFEYLSRTHLTPDKKVSPELPEFSSTGGLDEWSVFGKKEEKSVRIASRGKLESGSDKEEWKPSSAQDFSAAVEQLKKEWHAQERITTETGKQMLSFLRKFVQAGVDIDDYLRVVGNEVGRARRMLEFARVYWTLTGDELHHATLNKRRGAVAFARLYKDWFSRHDLADTIQHLENGTEMGDEPIPVEELRRLELARSWRVLAKSVRAMVVAEKSIHSVTPDIPTRQPYEDFISLLPDPVLVSVMQEAVRAQNYPFALGAKAPSISLPSPVTADMNVASQTQTNPLPTR